jgi:hypothetical protein
VLFKDLGDALADHVSSAGSEVLLVAPFVKVGALEKVLAGLRPGVDLTLVTRWRLDEIAAGVSDVDAYNSVVARGGTVRLLDRLHAKFYRADDLILVGSANLTSTALGWVHGPNLETLHRIRSDGLVGLFERAALAESILVDPETAERFGNLERELRALGFHHEDVAGALSGIDVVSDSLLLLLPRDPGDLWIVYVDQDCDLVAEVQRESIGTLLRKLGVPPGLRSEQIFADAVGERLWQSQEVRELHHWLGDGRRFGEVAVWLGGKLDLDRDASTYLCQSLIRVLTRFAPRKFARDRPRHTEIFSAR